MKFTHVQGPALGQNGQLSVDGASKDCVDWFLQNGLSAALRPFPGRFRQDDPRILLRRAGDPRRLGHGAERRAGRAGTWIGRRPTSPTSSSWPARSRPPPSIQYLDAFAETWGRTMYGGMARWCHEHGVKSMGHFMEHGALYVRPEFCAGDMMRLQKYSDMGAIDAVFTSSSWASESPATPHLANAQAGQLDLARLRQAGRRGDGRDLRRRGQDLTYPEMKWWADHMQVVGRQLPDPAFVQSALAVRHRLPAVFLQRRLRAALAALSRVCRLHQPAEPDAHRRAARLPRGAACSAATPARSARSSRPRT